MLTDNWILIKLDVRPPFFGTDERQLDINGLLGYPNSQRHT